MEHATSNTLLLVEDDIDIVNLVRLRIGDIGLEVEHASDGQLGLEKALMFEYAAIILDLNLPKLGGLEVCRRIREENLQVPIMMLTSRSEEVNKVLGLELGADDYVTKPFSIAEFLARVKALQRRSALSIEGEDGSKSESIIHKDLHIDLSRRKVMLGEREIETTPREYDLLVFLASSPGRPYSREQITQYAWGHEFTGYDHTVSSHINRLRAKIEEDPANACYIQTVFGFGYKFADPE